VADNGGVIESFRSTRATTVSPATFTHIERMIEVVGVGSRRRRHRHGRHLAASFLAYDDYGDWPTIGAALLARGRSREDVVKVLGGNFRRVFEDVTAV
jgi:microsomal dipeptidase-like Zn-dependent dipeptidase